MEINILKYIIYHLLIRQEYSEMFWKMSIKIINTVKDHYSTEVFLFNKTKMDIKDSTTKLTFTYELSGTTAINNIWCSIYALTVYEQVVALIQKDGKILLTSSFQFIYLNMSCNYEKLYNLYYKRIMTNYYY